MKHKKNVSLVDDNINFDSDTMMAQLAKEESLTSSKVSRLKGTRDDFIIRDAFRDKVREVIQTQRKPKLRAIIELKYGR